MPDNLKCGKASDESCGKGTFDQVVDACAKTVVCKLCH